MRAAVHASDVDGIVCAALILMKYPNSKLDFLTVGEALKTEEEYDLVVDLPKTKNAKVNIDHHISNYQRLLSEGRLSEDDLIDPTAPSAAHLLIKYLKLKDNPRAKELVEMADIADTGGYSKETYILDRIIKCNSNEPDKLMKIAWALIEHGKDFLNDEFMRLEWERIKKGVELGKEYSRRIINEALNKGVEILIVDLVKGFPKVAIADLQHDFLDRGGKIIIVINRMRDIDKFCPSLKRNGNLVRFSMRVAKNFDFNIRELAEKIGGGGHPKASGAAVNESEYGRALLTLIEELSKVGIIGYYLFSA